MTNEHRASSSVVFTAVVQARMTKAWTLQASEDAEPLELLDGDRNTNRLIPVISSQVFSCIKSCACVFAPTAPHLTLEQ